MGLRRLPQQDCTCYLYFRISSGTQGEQVLEAILLQKGNTSTVKVTTDNKDLQQWCIKLNKSPEEYMTLLCEALGSEDSNEGVFDVQGDHLIWKQYFPDQDIYGKKGKFKMEKMEYEEGVERVLEGAMRDLLDLTRHVTRLTKESQENAKRLDELQDLAAKSVQMKEDFEKEIYSKCAAIINAKKLRIHQLRSSHPSSSAGQTSCLTRTSDEVGTAISRPVKQAKQEANNNDGYSSDTDVDDPDEQEMDTDEEKTTSFSPVKQQGKITMDRNLNVPSKAPVEVDSQELFNQSLEAELYPSGATANPMVPINVATSTFSKPPPTEPPQLTRTKTDHSSKTSSDPNASKEPVLDDDLSTQKSIFDELF